MILTKRQLLLLLLPVFFMVPACLSAQTAGRKKLEIEDLTRWNRLEGAGISNDGRWVSYTLDPEEGDPVLFFYDGENGRQYSFERAGNASLSADSHYAVFLIHPPEDSIKAMRRRKVDKENLPGDTLGILDLQSQQLTKIPDVKSFRLPEKWSGWLAYTVAPSDADTTRATRPKKKKPPTLRLVLQRFSDGKQVLVEGIKSYQPAEEGARFAMVSEGKDSTFLPGIYLFDAQQAELRPVWRGKGSYKQVVLDKPGRQVAFLADLDTTKVRIRPFGLYHWQEGPDSARLVAGMEASFLPKDWLISENGRLEFSGDGSRLFFGIAPSPILQDTALLDEEIVNVEVWHTDDDFLYTQAEVQSGREKNRTYTCVYFPAAGRLVQLATEQVPELNTGEEGLAPFALGYDDRPYRKALTWEGGPTYKDLYLIDVSSGRAERFIGGVRGEPALSPAGKYVYWYSQPDTAWFAWSIEKKDLKQLTGNRQVSFADELNDQPDYPSPYGLAGWLKDDAAVLIYDRFDLWQIDPEGQNPPKRLTNGRGNDERLRVIRLDPEKRYLEPNERLLLHRFREKTKDNGYAWLDLSGNRMQSLQLGPYSLTRRVLKARDADRYVFTREDFHTFPDLLYSTDLINSRTVSQANPQQKDYLWGTIGLYEWTALDGQRLQGLLVKPEGFDPSKKYPMIVNFYERSSDDLHDHRAPSAGRSTINYAYYASRGYLIFNPDVPYRIGYPGESAFNAVVSGVAALIDEGFVDKTRIGVQGHSWGGYQIAYLLTKTDIFRCAESGAPVVNMISAYGGIRWGSGMSRMFQYEHTQSRIGGSLWETPLRYLENSPIFNIDKINTPVLILHNDNDSAVPWYQGIEWFVAMRRLGKKAWMLNYNDEPHWPVKLQNRKDFNLRLSQFFDYYLMDGPMPRWMEKGVSPIEKGILQGYEAVERQ